MADDTIFLAANEGDDHIAILAQSVHEICFGLCREDVGVQPVDRADMFGTFLLDDHRGTSGNRYISLLLAADISAVWQIISDPARQPCFGYLTGGDTQYHFRRLHL